jgi:tetratricopeptide (TPR) repeat protein
MSLAVRSALVLAALALSARPAMANRESDALRARGLIEIYNLDRDQAIGTFRQAVAADPQDAAAYRGLAGALWLSITYRRGNMTVDDYLGRVNRTAASPLSPPPEAAAAFHDALERALTLARKRVETNARDASAHYEVGAAVGLHASYIATVEGRAVGAMRAAREAYEEQEAALELDPHRKDAGLIIGTYRYIVSTLAVPARLIAYMAGFGGGKDHGLRMIEEAAAYPGENQTDARVALVLIYNREQRYDQALEQLAILRQQFPRNRLLWLEAGATSLRAGRPADAERFLADGFSRLARDDRPRMFGEDALWLYKRGAARAALGRTAEAEPDLRRAVSSDGRKWVQGRAHLELGKLELKAGNRAAAAAEFQAAAALCDADNDGATADEARRLLKQ